MRRLLNLITALVLLPGVATAQVLGLGEVLPGGNAPASVSVVNTATATTIYSVTVPAKVFGQFKGSARGATRLHMNLIGYLSAASGGRMNLGCNYGGATATIALINGLTFDGALSSVPFVIDVWLAANSAGTGQVLWGRWATLSNVNIAASVSGMNSGAALVIGTTSMATNQTLTCIAQWAAASTGSSLTISNGVTAVGQ